MSQMFESFMQQAPLASMRAQPVELQESVGHSEPGAVLLRDAHPLHAVKVRLDVRVGEAVLSIGELLTARENQVLVLDRTIEQPVDLVLEGKVVGRGQLVAVDDGNFAVRITEVPLPLKI
jgi:flagellar motor switch protein FliN/FliY